MITGQIVPNFTLAEMACKDKSQTLILTPKLVEFAQMVQTLRDYLKAPLKVNSWFRTPEYNKSVGGAKNSAHLQGRAVDLKVKPALYLPITDLWYEICKENDIQGTIIYYTNFIHIDNFGREKGQTKFTIIDRR